MKVGLFFGSFNPIHVGHLIIADTVLNNSDLNRIWFVVSPQNPFKTSSKLLHEFDRLDMVRAAINDNPNFHASDIEFSLPRPSYTATTLAYLSDKYKSYNFKVIIGEDNLENFKNWRNYEVILEQYGLYVYPRPKSSGSDLKQNEQVVLVEAPKMDISSTYIRKSVMEGKSVRYLVTDEVNDLIESRKYYQ
jgi:nicotinate-nucleotide adenylyltransferase